MVAHRGMRKLERGLNLAPAELGLPLQHAGNEHAGRVAERLEAQAGLFETGCVPRGPDHPSEVRAAVALDAEGGEAGPEGGVHEDPSPPASS